MEGNDMEEMLEIVDKDDNIITEDFLSWILLDLDARGSAAAIGTAMGTSKQQTHPQESAISMHESPNFGQLPPSERRMSSNGSVSSGENGGDGGNDSNDSDNQQPGQKRKTSRSRELAKESRKRQRQRMEDMEKKIATLKKENEELQAYLQNVTQRTTEVQKQRLDMERIMSAKLCDMSTMSESDSELEDVLRKFVDLYADYGIYRQKEVAFHIAQLEKLLLPTQTMKLAIWTMQQDLDICESAGQSPMLDILSKELELTSEQTTAIKRQRTKAISFLNQLRESMGLIKGVKVAIERKHAVFDTTCGRIMKEATPQQNVKFLLWITRNADQLASVIPDFKRSVPHVPHAPILSTPEPSTSSKNK